ncbi:SDR family NAD(P)-dependent oxidoreductase [Legionella dresdenensis]|uniref:SDR family NAD(P)-dependent oxidoreductase n=1 Tax=Legionella dresdenensis TaxID=450200 RepID=A0ABV8CDA8_9GAMM
MSNDNLIDKKKYLDNGANVVMVAEKTDEIPNHTLFSEKAMVVAIDFTDEKQINAAVKASIERFGSIDILINNYSTFNFKSTADTTPEMFHQVMTNVFATFFFSQACAPYLKRADNPHIINISPPLDMDAAKLACEHHLLFSISKYGMSFSTLGMAEEFRPLGIAVNSLWQERPIATKTLIDNFDNEVVRGSNRPEVYADAAYLISLKSAQEFTGNYCIDEDILRESNIDLAQYAVNAEASPVKDIFLPGVDYTLLKTVF